jgi:hypothetical protein
MPTLHSKAQGVQNYLDPKRSATGTAGVGSRFFLNASLSGVQSRLSDTKGTTMTDPTEAIRCQRLAEINLVPGSREALEAQHGQVWDTDELMEEFEAIGFMAPLIVVRRRADGVKGSLEFQHSPRLYFNWQPHK